MTKTEIIEKTIIIIKKQNQIIRNIFISRTCPGQICSLPAALSRFCDVSLSLVIKETLILEINK